MSEPLLKVEDLVVDFGTKRKPFHAVDVVSLQIAAGETLGLVGESGSGKSTIGRAILGLNPVSQGRITFDGKDLSHIHAKDRKNVAEDLQVVFQDPYSSLNPSLTVGQILSEPLMAKKQMSNSAARERIQDLLSRVGLPKDAIDRFPSRFSGGQRQRIAIARSLALSPKLVICDEPVSALDLSTQAQVLNLLSDLRGSSNLAYLFIAHDLAVVKHLSQRIVVLYRGRIMEEGDAREVYNNPAHPYTRALIAAAPVPNVAEQRVRRARRASTVSASSSAILHNAKDGCPFAGRCPVVQDVCKEQRPNLSTVGVSSSGIATRAACHAYDASSGHSGL
jgi:oligopeptide/dipeptide ABC transporter ATP-binding protein